MEKLVLSIREDVYFSGVNCNAKIINTIYDVDRIYEITPQVTSERVIVTVQFVDGAVCEFEYISTLDFWEVEGPFDLIKELIPKELDLQLPSRKLQSPW